MDRLNFPDIWSKHVGAVSKGIADLLNGWAPALHSLFFGALLTAAPIEGARAGGLGESFLTNTWSFDGSREAGHVGSANLKGHSYGQQHNVYATASLSKNLKTAIVTNVAVKVSDAGQSSQGPSAIRERIPVPEEAKVLFEEGNPVSAVGRIYKLDDQCDPQPDACIDLWLFAVRAELHTLRSRGMANYKDAGPARRLLELLEKNPNRDKSELAAAHLAIGYTQVEHGSLTAGEQHLRQYFELTESFKAGETNNFLSQDDFRLACLGLAKALASQGKFTAAFPFLEIVGDRDRIRPQSLGFDELMDEAMSFSLIPRELLPTGIDDADLYFEAARKKLPQRPNPSLTRLQIYEDGIVLKDYHQLSRFYSELGVHRVRREQFADAIQSLDTARSLPVTTGRRQIRVDIALATALLAEGKRTDEAEKLFAESSNLIEDSWLAKGDHALFALRSIYGRYLLHVKKDPSTAFRELEATESVMFARAEGTDNFEDLARTYRQARSSTADIVDALWQLGGITPDEKRLADEFPEAGKHNGWQPFVFAQGLTNYADSAATLARLTAVRHASDRSPSVKACAAKLARKERLERDLHDLSQAKAPQGVALSAIKLWLAVQSQMDALEVKIKSEDPEFFGRRRMVPMIPSEVQHVLKADEALLLVVTGERHTTTFVVTREELGWSRSELGEAELATRVSALRDQLEVDVGSSRGLVREGKDGSAFDADAAHQLYKAILEPVRQKLNGKKVVFVTANGPLSSLPLGALVDSPPTGGETPQYLIDKFAFAILPAVSTLRMMRCPADAPGTDECAPAGRPVHHLSLAAVGAPTLSGAPGVSRSTPFDTAYSGVRANPDFLRKLPYLPGTKRELEQLKTQFPTNSVITLGDQASEAFVRTNPDITTARYVVFSTHGLLANQSGRGGEPGLVFTPPAQGAASEADDGLLTTSEAAQMTLSADFLVLSACNTAAASGQFGGESLSGLARAFLGAGARSLLVSHWQVDDAASAALIGRTFAFAEGGSNKAVALQKAVLEHKQQKNWSSPAFWAPFVFVGTGD